MNKDKQFYKMIIKDAEKLLPVVTISTFLCHQRKCSKWLKIIIKKIAKENFIKFSGSPFIFTRIERNVPWSYYQTTEFKEDRIFLLNEIIRYCKSKL